MRSSLPSLALLLLAIPLSAQEHLPQSTQELLAAVARIEAVTPSDFKVLLSQAEAGDREAQYLLALAYEGGLAVNKDDVASRSWMMTSAEQGYVPAEAGMGETYLQGLSAEKGAIPNYGAAERWLRLAATEGNAEAQMWLGTGYERGYFGTTDYREAFKWLRRSAEQGSPLAQFELAQMYDGGEGVSESDVHAAYWYRRAADHATEAGGVWEAVVQLVNMYHDERLPKDRVQAYMWSAIVESCFSPPSDDNMEWAARQMTKAQIQHAQLMARDWIQRHTPHGEDQPHCDRDPLSSTLTRQVIATKAARSLPESLASSPER
jgi:hypothetical protein